MKKKFIIIIVFVIAALYIAWRKGWLTKKADMVYSTTNSDGMAGLNQLVATTSDVSSKCGLTVAEKNKLVARVRMLYELYNDSDVFKYNIDDLQYDATKYGRSLEKQLILSALWSLGPDGWQNSQDTFSVERYKELVPKFQQLQY